MAKYTFEFAVEVSFFVVDTIEVSYLECYNSIISYVSFLHLFFWVDFEMVGRIVQTFSLKWSRLVHDILVNLGMIWWSVYDLSRCHIKNLSLKYYNVACLGKWLWHFEAEDWLWRLLVMKEIALKFIKECPRYCIF